MRFLVLSPTSVGEGSVQNTSSHRFLSLSPTLHGPEPALEDEDAASSQSIVYTPTSAFLTLSPVHSGRPQAVRSRSDSVSSVASSVSSRPSAISSTPSGRFLYLGY